MRPARWGCVESRRADWTGVVWEDSLNGLYSAEWFTTAAHQIPDIKTALRESTTTSSDENWLRTSIYWFANLQITTRRVGAFDRRRRRRLTVQFVEERGSRNQFKWYPLCCGTKKKARKGYGEAFAFPQLLLNSKKSVKEVGGKVIKVNQLLIKKSLLRIIVVIKRSCL